MDNRFGKKFFFISALLFFTLFVGFISIARSGDTHSAYYSSKNDRIFWFIQMSDIHIGARGTQDSQNLQWIVTDAKNIIDPGFIVASGDLTDSTNGNIFGFPDGPYQEEWNEYRAILNQAGIDASVYYDIPGNHEAYNDHDFSYYLANSVQGQATGQTQISWTREFDFGKYHFLGINTADNTGDPFSLFFPWGDHAGLDENELTFIHAALEEHRDTDITLIFGHHPVTDTGYSTDTWLFYGQEQIIGYLDSYGASLYGYGHTHRFGEDIFSGNSYTGFMQGEGIYYFNIASLGKSSENQYSIIAVDCNGISILTTNVDTWPAVLITAPLDKDFGGAMNPYAYTVPSLKRNPVRALVFDPNSLTGVHYRIDASGEWLLMNPVPENPHLWEAVWDASALPEGEHSVEVRAASASGTSTALILVNVVPPIILPWLPLLLL
ncbi:MAG: metallophosphoesterase [Deltaproteobacteria bacterium]|nr:metallophosphoesterase [Deltaproteobacteria bacterium]